MTGQRFGLDDLPEGERERLRLRLEHLLEVETGFRSGSRYWARPDEPRAAYDPATTTLTERRRAKAVELGTLDNPDQRQGRTLPPHPARRMGLPPALHLRRRTTSSISRLAGLYNYHRPHTGISGHTPASRVTNLSGRHI